jgi:chromosome segregation ATPase
MNTIEIYKQEIEADLDLARGKLVELKEKIRGFSDAERLDAVLEIEDLEKMASDMRTQTKELDKAMKDSWEQIKSDIDSSRNTINEDFSRLNRSLV